MVEYPVKIRLSLDTDKIADACERTGLYDVDVEMDGDDVVIKAKSSGTYKNYPSYQDRDGMWQPSEEYRHTDVSKTDIEKELGEFFLSNIEFGEPMEDEC